MVDPIVLMVAEKPSISNSIASILSGGSPNRRSGACRNSPVYEFPGKFMGRSVTFRVTAVLGHVLSTDFPPKYQNWDTTDPASLFAAEIVKSESDPKANVVRHLQQEARGASFLVLWLDCDREGENICFEVIDNTVSSMLRLDGKQQVFRAKFSSVTAQDIRAALTTLGVPDKNAARAVDAR